MSDSPDVVLERSFYIGIIVSSILYGLQLQLYFQSVYMMVISSPVIGRLGIIYLVLGGLICLGMTAGIAGNDVFGQLMWIEHRDFPGGPLAYFVAETSLWVNVLSTAGGFLAQTVADAMLIYRTYIIWDGNWGVIVLPILMYLATIVMGIIELLESAVPGNNFFRGDVVKFGVAWASLSVAENAVVTAIICYRLLMARRFLGAVMPTETVQLYTGVMAILVESALPMTLMGIIYAVTYGRNLDTAPAFALIWGSIASIAPQAILFRVAMGRAWSSDVASQVATQPIAFARPGPAVTSETSELGLVHVEAGSTLNNGNKSYKSEQSFQHSV